MDGNKQMKKENVKFYFESFLITFSAFMGGVLSLIINKIWLNTQNDLTNKISWSIMIFTLTLMIVLLILYLIIWYIGFMVHREGRGR